MVPTAHALIFWNVMKQNAAIVCCYQQERKSVLALEKLFIHVLSIWKMLEETRIILTTVKFLISIIYHAQNRGLKKHEE